MIGALGGFMSIIAFAFSGFVATYYNFNTDNTIISKLYTLPGGSKPGDESASLRQREF